MSKKFDFIGWATKNDLICSDGRIIRKDAFKHNDGKKVALVWNHLIDDPQNIMGHAVLHNDEGGVLAGCNFNNTEAGNTGKEIVKHGDIFSLSIRANKLKQIGSEVIHGDILEVSLVPSGANPGAVIEEVMVHGDDNLEAIIYTGLTVDLKHSDDYEIEDDEEVEDEDLEHADDETIEDIFSTLNEKQMWAVEAVLTEAMSGTEDTSIEHADGATDGEETILDIFNTLNEKQMTAVMALLAEALGEGDNMNHSEGEGDDEMKQNAFETQSNNTATATLTHAQQQLILDDAKRIGSLKEAILQHSEGELMHGIEQVGFLFPDAQNLHVPPALVQRDQTWVDEVLNGITKTPFSRIKTIFADLTADELKAKGYIKGKLKTEDAFKLLKRVTTAKTIYVKDRIDRDDVVDITDFEVVAWLQSIMRGRLNETIARAVLIGDGRTASSEDKIDEDCIRPIWTDDDFYTIKALVEPSNDTEKELVRSFIRTAVKARKDYKGSGNPVLFAPEDIITACLLVEDLNERTKYDSIEKLAAALRVSKIISVPVMENIKRTDDKDGEVQLLGIITNLSDYTSGADKGGAINFMDQFDIDYNANKLLMETRCSGALVRPYSSIALECKVKPEAAG